MYNKHFEQDDEADTTRGNGTNTTGTATALAESSRSMTESSSRPEGRSDDEKISIFWRVFGGTILSMVALGAITLYNSISTSIAELRSELNREREARAELIKKDEFNTRITAQYERFRTFETLKADFEGLKERVNSSATGLDSLKKDAGTANDLMKKDMAALEVLKERVLALEGVKKDLAGLDILKEKLTAATVDLKAMRDDVMKIQQEQERNRASDLERKSTRDAQYKHLEETMKELQKGLQDCREKLARLEGMQPATQARPMAMPPEIDPTPVKPLPPSENKGSGDPAGAGSSKTNPTGTGNTGTSKPGPRN